MQEVCHFHFHFLKKSPLPSSPLLSLLVSKVSHVRHFRHQIIVTLVRGKMVKCEGNVEEERRRRRRRRNSFITFHFNTSRKNLQSKQRNWKTCKSSLLSWNNWKNNKSVKVSNFNPQSCKLDMGSPFLFWICDEQYKERL